MSETHFIELASIERSIFRGKPAAHVRAVCGRIVPRVSHANDPNCAACLHFLKLRAQLDEDDKRTALALEAEYPEFSGRLACPELAEKKARTA